MKPEGGTAAVTAESLSRLASVGLLYGFFIGCLGPVDDQDSNICPTATASSEDVIWRQQLAGELPSAPANLSLRLRYDLGPERLATTLDSFWRFDSTGFS